MKPTEHSNRLKEEPVNSKIFLQKSEDKIRQDEVFFYRYFKQKETTDKKVKTEELENNSDDELDAVESMYDVDFASDMKKSKNIKKKKKSGDSDDDDDEYDSDEGDDVDDDDDDDAQSSDASFDYDDMNAESDDEDFDEGNPKKKKKFTDKDYEEALFQNLNSDGESINGDGNDMDAGDDEGLGSMFAAADEFAHLLEKANDSKNIDGVHPKQRKWEERNEQGQSWKDKKRFSQNKIGPKSFQGKRKRTFKDQRTKNFSKSKAKR